VCLTSHHRGWHRVLDLTTCRVHQGVSGNGRQRERGRAKARSTSHPGRRQGSTTRLTSNGTSDALPETYQQRCGCGRTWWCLCCWNCAAWPPTVPAAFVSN